MDEEGAHEEADADEEVERVDERAASLWTEGEHEEDAVRREEDSIASKLHKGSTPKKNCFFLGIIPKLADPPSVLLEIEI